MLAAIDIFAGIIEHLGHVRKRPSVFMGSFSEEGVWAYLAGFRSAAQLCGYEIDADVFWMVCAERGWEINSLGPQKRMREAGWSDDAIIDELLAIEIETWKRILTGSAQVPTTW